MNFSKELQAAGNLQEKYNDNLLIPKGFPSSKAINEIPSGKVSKRRITRKKQVTKNNRKSSIKELCHNKNSITSTPHYKVEARKSEDLSTPCIPKHPQSHCQSFWHDGERPPQLQRTPFTLRSSNFRRHDTHFATWWKTKDMTSSTSIE